MLIKNITEDRTMTVIDSKGQTVDLWPLETVSVWDRTGKGYLANYSSIFASVEVESDPKKAETKVVDEKSKEWYKEQLTAMGVEFHPMLGIKKLTALYNESK